MEVVIEIIVIAIVAGSWAGIQSREHWNAPRRRI